MALTRQDSVTDMAPDGARAGVCVGLIGKGIQLSRTPLMHMAEAQALELDYRYVLIDPDTMDGPEPSIAELIASAEAQGFAGLNITFPYKQEVIAHLDDLSGRARAVGAVNTVVFRDGRRCGHNTDFWGFAEAMQREMSGVRLNTVLLLGAGGAGRAVAHALKSLGVDRLLIADIDRNAADSLARKLGAEVAGELAEAVSRADGIVNATPVGMEKLPGTAIDPNLLKPRHWVADIVYFPLETELLREAKARGCRTWDGSGMAVFQAVRAFTLFSGHTPDPDRMRATFEAFSNPTNTQHGG